MTIALEMQRNRLAGNKIHAKSQPVDHIAEALGVYGEKAVTDSDSRFLGCAVGIDFVDDDIAAGIFHAETGAPKTEKGVVREAKVAEDTGDGTKNDPRTWADRRHGGL